MFIVYWNLLMCADQFIYHAIGFGEEIYFPPGISPEVKVYPVAAAYISEQLWNFIYRNTPLFNGRQLPGSDIRHIDIK